MKKVSLTKHDWAIVFDILCAEYLNIVEHREKYSQEKSAWEIKLWEITLWDIIKKIKEELKKRLWKK